MTHITIYKIMKKHLSFLIKLPLLLMLYHADSRAIDPIYTSGSSNIAIKGYDTVAYFTENKAIKGDKEMSVEYQGAVWHFSSAENLDTFITQPEKYIPQYGGYCAYAVSRNTTASINPKAFNVYEGKLYLNYSKGVQKRWMKDLEAGIKKANTHWPKLLKK
jgi:YHS domain-containing protein